MNEKNSCRNQSQSFIFNPEEVIGQSSRGNIIHQENLGFKVHPITHNSGLPQLPPRSLRMDCGSFILSLLYVYVSTIYSLFSLR